MTKLTASKLREDIYRILDRVIETGQPVIVERKGQILTINPQKRRDKLDNLVKRNAIKGNPEDLVHCDWSAEWEPCI